MGTDLVSACVFCAGLLLGMDLRPMEGTTAEMALAYATMSRLAELPDSELTDISDVTPKFITIGMRGARGAPGELGAGTPAREWRLRVALAPSHDEQRQQPRENPGRIRATGTGRFENVAALYRHRFTASGSAEVAWNRRAHKATDLVNLGGENFELDEQRTLSSERADVALGWRHRWRGLEIAAAARYTSLESANTTAAAFHFTEGTLWGAEAEARWARGPWALRLAAETSRGDLEVHEESAPDFASRDFDADAELRAFTAALTYSSGKTDALFSYTRDESSLPFVSHAVLGYETVRFDSGFHPDSETRENIWDLTVRHRFTPTFSARIFLRAIYGEEDLTLTDSAGARPRQRITIDRSGDIGKGTGSLDFLGSPQLVIGLGAEFSIAR
jgi:hypothetical protein